MLPTGLKLFADEADPIQIDPHGEFFVFLLYFPVARAFLCQCLMVHRQSKHDICADLTGVELAVETAKLDRMVTVEEAMQIEEVVTAVMVVTIAVAAITGVPDILQLRESVRLLLIESLHQIGIHLQTIPHPLRLDLKCFIEQIISTGDEIDEVTDGSWCVRFSIEVDMDTTGVVSDATSFSDAPDNVLQCSNIFPVSEDGADQFTGIFITCGYQSAAFSSATVNTAVVHEFPVSCVRAFDDVTVVVIVSAVVAAIKILRNYFRCLLTGDPGKLDLDSELTG